MGVPTFYRWLCTKYPKVVKDAIEQKADLQDGKFVPTDLNSPNPNSIEFDNLYIDMNGVVHPCCHPEDSRAPKDESEMFINVCDYIDRIINIVRPRKLLFLALDGVAPRAKMNQQRSRRFKAGSEAESAEMAYEELKAQFEAEGREICAQVKRWDSNVITPGTPFMDRLAQVLRYYVAKRMEESTYWQSLTVLLSDSNRPGEGEHKVMAYVRTQRQMPNYNPNTTHCIHGMDADLIMLGLATHEPHFYIVREVVMDKKKDETKCGNCGRMGHNTQECRQPPTFSTNTTAVDVRQDPEAMKTYGSFRDSWKPLQFLQLPILREYMELEFKWDPVELITQDDQGRLKRVPTDVERHIDDFVLICFFVGNDFLPHLPSLSIHKGSIDQMITLYKAIYPSLGDYLTNAGIVNFHAVHKFCRYLAEVEPEVLRSEHFRKQRQKRQREEQDQGRKRTYAEGASSAPPKRFKAGNDGLGAEAEPPSADTPYSGRRRDSDAASDDSSRSSLGGFEGIQIVRSSFQQSIDDFKEALRKKLQTRNEVDSPTDDIQLGNGDPSDYRQRYYVSKFHLLYYDNIEYSAASAAQHFVRGLQWVFLYYYQGVPSWDWYYPYHYAPLATDIYSYGFDSQVTMHSFVLGKPFSPLEQLLSVLPPRSAKFLPEPYAKLMTDPDSEIADFYPTRFHEDADGKRFRWQWVALLPFIDPLRLRAATETCSKELTDAEIRRNTPGEDLIFVWGSNPLSTFIDDEASNEVLIDGHLPGVAGWIASVDKSVFKKGRRIVVDCDGFVPFKSSCSAAIFRHHSGKHHSINLLEGAIPPPRVLSEVDEVARPGRNLFNSKAAKRMILSVVGGPHYDKFCEEERRDRENSRSHFQNVLDVERKSMNRL